MASFKRMGSDQEVRQNTPRAWISLFSSTCSVNLEGSPCRSPNRFLHRPVNADRGFPTEQMEKGFAPTGRSHQFSKNRARDKQGPTCKRFIQSRLGGRVEPRVTVPESNDDVGINGCLRHDAFPGPISQLPCGRNRCPGCRYLDTWRRDSLSWLVARVFPFRRSQIATYRPVEHLTHGEPHGVS